MLGIRCARDQVGGALAAPGSFDGVEAGEGARRHQLLPGREVVDGPHVVLCGIESDPAELAGGQPASVEDEPHLVQRQARPGVKEVRQEQLRRVQIEFEARLLDRLAPGGLQRVLAWGVQIAARELPESRAVDRAELDRPVVFVADVEAAVHRVVGDGLRVLRGRHRQGAAGPGRAVVEG